MKLHPCYFQITNLKLEQNTGKVVSTKRTVHQLSCQSILMFNKDFIVSHIIPNHDQIPPCVPFRLTYCPEPCLTSCLMPVTKPDAATHALD